MKIVTLVLVLALSACASTRVGKGLDVGVGVSAGLDYHSTRQAITSGQGHEGNAVVGQDAWRQALVKVLGAGAVIGFARVIEQQKPALAHVLRAAAITGWSIVAARNYQIARR